MKKLTLMILLTILTVSCGPSDELNRFLIYEFKQKCTKLSEELKTPMDTRIQYSSYGFSKDLSFFCLGKDVQVSVGSYDIDQVLGTIAMIRRVEDEISANSNSND